MKSKLLTIILFALSIPFLHAQSGLSKAEFTSLIGGKWKLAEALTDGIKMPSSEMDMTIMSFESNGTYEMREQGESHHGKWSFNVATQELATDEGEEKAKHKVLKLTKTLLMIETKDPNETLTMTFSRL